MASPFNVPLSIVKPGNIWLNTFTNLYYVSIKDHTGPLESLRTLVGSQQQLLRVEVYHFQNKSPYCSLARRRPVILRCVANCRTQVVGNLSWYPTPLVFGENFCVNIHVQKRIEWLPPLTRLQGEFWRWHDFSRYQTATITVKKVN